MVIEEENRYASLEFISTQYFYQEVIIQKDEYLF